MSIEYTWIFSCLELDDEIERLNCIRRVVKQDPSALQMRDCGASPLSAAINSGDVSAVALLLSLGANATGTPASKGSTISECLLCDAVEHSPDETSFEIMRLLIAGGADLNSRGSFGTALHVAVNFRSATKARYLLAMGADIDSCEASEGQTPLWVAAFSSCVEMVALLIEHGANPFLRDGTLRETPREIAASSSDADRVEVIQRMLAEAEAEYDSRAARR